MSADVAVGSIAFEPFLADTNRYVSALCQWAASVRDREPTTAQLLEGFAATTAAGALELVQQWPYVLISRSPVTSG